MRFDEPTWSRKAEAEEMPDLIPDYSERIPMEKPSLYIPIPVKMVIQARKRVRKRIKAARVPGAKTKTSQTWRRETTRPKVNWKMTKEPQRGGEAPSRRTFWRVRKVTNRYFEAMTKQCIKVWASTPDQPTVGEGLAGEDAEVMLAEIGEEVGHTMDMRPTKWLRQRRCRMAESIVLGHQVEARAKRNQSNDTRMERLRIGGHKQACGVDYDAKYALVVDFHQPTLMMAIVATDDFLMEKIDVKGVFLCGKIGTDLHVD